MSSPSHITTNVAKVSPPQSATAIVGLGSNLSFLKLAPEQIVLAAMERLRALSLEVKTSSLYLTEALDCPAGTADFVNAVMLLRLPAGHCALELLDSLQAIEADFDRQRGAQKNQARTLDLDLISFQNQQHSDERLILPHPRAMQRKFVMLPLAEIVPNLILPGQGQTVMQLLDQLKSPEKLKRIS